MEPPSGRLAACEFRGACDALVAAWRRHGCGGEWRWRDAAPSPLRASAAARLVAPGWLELEGHLVRAAPAQAEAGRAPPGSSADAAVRAGCDAEEEEDEAALVLPAPCVTWHVYTLAVVFHAAYAVPWLLLRGAAASGAPLTWRQLLDDLRPRLGPHAQLPGPDAAALEGAFGALTPTEHPHTGEPWFGLHPCTTAEVLALLLATGDPAGPADDAARLGRYMRAWWSVAGAAVGAPLPLTAYAPPNAAAADPTQQAHAM